MNCKNDLIIRLGKTLQTNGSLDICCSKMKESPQLIQSSLLNMQMADYININ